MPLLCNFAIVCLIYIQLHLRRFLVILRNYGVVGAAVLLDSSDEEDNKRRNEVVDPFKVRDKKVRSFEEQKKLMAKINQLEEQLRSNGDDDSIEVCKILLKSEILSIYQT